MWRGHFVIINYLTALLLAQLLHEACVMFTEERAFNDNQAF